MVNQARVRLASAPADGGAGGANHCKRVRTAQRGVGGGRCAYHQFSARAHVVEASDASQLYHCGLPPYRWASAYCMAPSRCRSSWRACVLRTRAWPRARWTRQRGSSTRLPTRVRTGKCWAPWAQPASWLPPCLPDRALAFPSVPFPFSIPMAAFLHSVSVCV